MKKHCSQQPAACGPAAKMLREPVRGWMSQHASPTAKCPWWRPVLPGVHSHSQLEKSPESKANPLRTRLPLCHLGLATRVGREAADVTKTPDHEAFL